MSKYYKAEDVIRWINAELKFQDIPTIEVSEGLIGQGSGDIDLQAVTSTGQEIYAKGYEDGRKSVEVSEDCISRKWILKEFQKGKEKISKSEYFDELMWNVKHAPSVVPTDMCKICQQYDIGYDDGRLDMLQKLNDTLKLSEDNK